KTDHHLPNRVYQKHGAIYYVDHSNKWKRLGTEWNTESKALWVKLSEQHQTIRGSMVEVMNRYMEDVAPKKSPRSFNDNLRQIKPLQAVFGKMRPIDIKPTHIYRYIDKRKINSLVGARQEKALLSHIFTKAIEWGIVERNPCKEVKMEKPPERDRYITDEEFSAVKSVSNETVKNIMDFAYLTAQRIGDILNVKLTDLGDDGVFIIPGKTKNSTKKKLLIKWTPELKVIVDRIRKQDNNINSIYLFFGRGGKPYTYYGFSSMFRRSVLKAGVKDFHFHDIRAKALTDNERMGNQNTQLLAGHSTRQMTDHYVKQRFVEEVTPLHRIIGE
ncbi:MAG: tyrosine-type recombinase/integrase, partial [Magnetococcales bacterium]|nr:tyrosine-type recombinase/integrase [Magnetococcales bacterium]